MCGICGIYGAGVDQGLLQRMMDSMSHRGPDGSGLYVADHIALGHRRLSIIDLELGAQPMSNESGDIYIVFNGEIYNHIELKVVLEQKGHLFKTSCDTEVILHAYEQWGEGCVNHLNGMFAFAIWHSTERRLFLARDHLGIKPLYYFQSKGMLIFASEIKALLQFTDCPRQVDIGSLGDLFTYRYVPSPKTLFQDISKLPPGHRCSITGNRVSISRFWRWKPTITIGQKEGEVIEQYQALLEDVIKLQLRSDVPVGLFLSSGIDSNGILAMMAQHISGPIHTFTIGFEMGEGTNETEDAAEMAMRFGADHTEMMIGPDDYERYFQTYLWDLEEPVGNETAAAFYFVSKIASNKVKVALTGQGADEPWAGYGRHVGVKVSELYSRLPLPLTGLLKRMVMFLPRNEWLKRGVISLREPDILERFNKIYSFFSSEMKDRLFQEWVKDGIMEAN
jgi:asparagine synthase (glutamine-hydrolysing)